MMGEAMTATLQVLHLVKKLFLSELLSDSIHYNFCNLAA